MEGHGINQALHDSVDGLTTRIATGHHAAPIKDLHLPIIEIPEQGKIQGRRVTLPIVAAHTKPGSVSAYIGIPFAQPPLGDLRWKRPQRPAPSWGNELRDSKWQADPQQIAGTELYNLRERMAFSEDCLYLNIWVPDSVRKGVKLPVMVWIYGMRGPTVQRAATG